jgi:RNA polymerase sigma factor (sigma-70 family)
MPILVHKPNDINEAARILSPMIYKMARKYSRNHAHRDLNDLFQDGMEGFTKAYHRFDAGRGMAFSSFVYQWAWAHIKDAAKGKWKDYNNTSGTSYEDHNLGTYNMPLDELIDSKAVADKMDSTTRAIHAARQQGYTYKAIAEAMTKLGKPVTLHQIRRRHLEALEA